MKLIKAITIAALVLILAGLVLGTGCGTQGPQGPAGAGIESVVNNGDGTFTLLLTDGSSFTTDNLTGPQGSQGDKGDTGATGLQGIQGPQGEEGSVSKGHKVKRVFRVFKGFRGNKALQGYRGHQDPV